MSTKKTRPTSNARKARAGRQSLRSQDPHLAREREKYENPLPSREFILQLVEAAGGPVPAEDIAHRLDIVPDEEIAFERRLGAMQRDGQLIINRRGDLCLPDKIELKAGRIEGHADGFGFFIPDDASGDLFISEKEMHQVLHGDRVMARGKGTVDRKGRKEGKIVEILERANTRLVGRFYEEKGHQWVVAENRRINQDIVVPPTEKHKARFGQVVMIEIIEQPSKHAPALGRIVEVMGNYADPGMEIEIALRKHNLPCEFPDNVQAQAKKLPKKVVKADLEGREDLRDLPLVTIDGEDARDFDDAVYCEPAGRGFKLWVAIADVSHYVRPGTPLDKDAYERGNSVYFPRRVIPMLPEELSNGLCSLNPEVDRCCMVCEMEIAATGTIKKYRFFPAVMHSKARLTYNQVWDWLTKPKNVPKDREWVMPHLENLNKLFQVLLKARWARGAIDFETLETKMVFDETTKKIEKIVPTARNDAHRIIEECMLAANVCASEFLKKKKQATLYRIHEGPTPVKRKALQEFLAEFGFYLGGGDDPHAKDYAELLNKIKGRPDEQLLQTVMLRSLQQAIYSPENVGHFGLAYESYTHFTSPIRRYPDLLVHRAIRAALSKEAYSPGNWENIGMHCSMTERRADDATRDVVAWLKCYYMQDKIGEEFDGVIASVVSFGIFVALNDVFVEGLVHVTELGQDYFHFDAARHQMLGERTGKRFRLGDKVRVRVAQVDLETAKIDFVMAEETATSAKPAAKAAGNTVQAKPVQHKVAQGKAAQAAETKTAETKTAETKTAKTAPVKPSADVARKPAKGRKPAAGGSKQK
jgi:ribonuclease R